LIFYFGTVDVHFSYFYKILNEKENIDKNDFIDNICKTYVYFIDSLSGLNKYIITPYYNPVNDENYLTCLLKYNVITEEIYKSVDKKAFEQKYNRQHRNEIVDLFHFYLKKYTKNKKIKIINLNKFVANKNGLIKEEFKDPVSIYNIHILWEPQIFYLINIFNKCGVSEKFLTDINKSKDKFLKWKVNEFKNKGLIK
jgi:hypothetical protein